MDSVKIVTLTVSPALDKSTHFKGLVPEQKIHCNTPRFDAGGGGINVSKAIARLGGNSMAVFTSGGPTGKLLEELVYKEAIAFQAVPIASWTRESFVAVDDNTNLQYRFGFSGGSISELEEANLLTTIAALQPHFFVLSGSTLEGLSTTFYQKIAQIASQNSSKLIVDTSGEALQKVLATGAYLIKPNVGELAKLIGVERLELEEVRAAARQLLSQNNVAIVVVSLGPQGAALVTATDYVFVPAPTVVKKSTVGAGDSMVGGMVWALSQNLSLQDVIRWGVACGSAATMNEGTQLFKQEDALRLFAWLKEKE